MTRHGMQIEESVVWLKKAPRTWYARLAKHLTKLGFSEGMVDNNLYLKEIGDGLLILIIFFDDMIFEGDDSESHTF